MEYMCVCLYVCISLAVRWAIGTFPYSGKNAAPMYGDYEAQRHWQEITVNLETNQWYKNGTDNDLLYWGLDYPPLTAYHSWIVGKIGLFFNETWVELLSSRGMESYQHKLFMRYSVLFSDLLVYIPSSIYYASQYPEKISSSMITALIFYPGLLLIDYGHFQYNCVSLGLFILAVALLDRGRLLLGSVSFCLALNYKQMELYHAMPFFTYILGLCVWKTGTVAHGFQRLVSVGLVVIGTFAVCWAPFLSSKEDALAVLERLFPFSRGLFEDKVSNFWCSLNVVFKIKDLMPQPTIVVLCGATTLLSILPSSVKLFLQPTTRNFKYSLVISSLGFFVFSYQVHEKTILIPMISTLLLVDEEPFISVWFTLISVFSMLPLLVKDGLLIATVATVIPFTAVMLLVFGQKITSTIHKLLLAGSSVGMVILTICTEFVPPPQRLPDLWPVLVSLYSCGHLVVFYIYFNYQLLYRAQSKRKVQ